jgi:hypothetical protein
MPRGARGAGKEFLNWVIASLLTPLLADKPNELPGVSFFLSE